MQRQVVIILHNPFDMDMGKFMNINRVYDHHNKFHEVKYGLKTRLPSIECKHVTLTCANMLHSLADAMHSFSALSFI